MSLDLTRTLDAGPRVDGTARPVPAAPPRTAAKAVRAFARSLQPRDADATAALAHTTGDSTAAAQALLDAGMDRADVQRWAHTVDPSEIDTGTTAGREFLRLLERKLRDGVQAGDALIKARYDGLVPHDLLAQREFRHALQAAWERASAEPGLGYAQRRVDALLEAQREHWVRLLPGHAEAVRTLSDFELLVLLLHDPGDVRKALSWGWELSRLSRTTVDELQTRIGFKDRASDSELDDPAFRADLRTADAGSPDAALRTARILALQRRLDGVMPAATVAAQAAALAGDALARLSALPAASLVSAARLGLGLGRIAAASTSQLAALAAAAPPVRRVLAALLGAGFGIDDARARAGATRQPPTADAPTRVGAEELNPGFVAALREAGRLGLAPDEAIVFARYARVTTAAERKDPDFRGRLMAAERAGLAEPAAVVRRARQLTLLARLGDVARSMSDGLAPLAQVLRADAALLQRLSAMDPARLQALWKLGVALPEMPVITDTQLHALSAATPALQAVRRQLLRAGMGVDDALRFAVADRPDGKLGAPGIGPRLDAQDLTPAFLQRLRTQLAQGRPALEAVLRARYADHASVAELDDPVFRKQLYLSEHATGVTTPAAAVRSARIAVLEARLPPATPHEQQAAWQAELRAMTDAQLAALVVLGRDSLSYLHELGFDASQMAECTPDHVAVLRLIDASMRRVVQAFVAAGMAVADAFTYAGSTRQAATATNPLKVGAEELGDAFSTRLSAGLREGLTARDAITCARWQHEADETELDDPAFRQALVTAEISWGLGDLNIVLRAARIDHVLRRVNAGQPTPLVTPDEAAALGDTALANLSQADPAAVARLRLAGAGVAQIAALGSPEIARLHATPAGFVEWVMRSLGGSVSELAALSKTERTRLEYWFTSGIPSVRAGDAFNPAATPPPSPPLAIGGGVLVWYETDGKPKIVQRAFTPDLYDALVRGLIAPGSVGMQRVGAIRAGLGLQAAFSVLDLRLGEQAVGEATLQRLMDRYRTLPESDKRVQLVRVLEARSVLAHGFDLLPYAELDSFWGSTERDFGDVTRMSPADVAELIDPAAVEARLATLMADPEIQAEYSQQLQACVAELGDTRTTQANALFTTLTSTSYQDALNAMHKEDLTLQAEEMLRGDLQALELLDPAKAQAARLHLNLHARAADLLELMADPAKLDTATMVTALADLAAILIQAERGAAGIVRHQSQVATERIALLKAAQSDKVLLTALAKVLRAGLIESVNKGTPLALANIDAAELKRLMSTASATVPEQGILGRFFGEAQRLGVWGSFSALGALASFGYKVSQGAFSADSGGLERWGAARDLVSFLSVIGHVAKSGATIADWYKERGAGLAEADKDKTWKALGLDRTLPEVFGRTSVLPGNARWSSAVDAMWDRYAAEADRHLMRNLRGGGDEALRLAQQGSQALAEEWTKLSKEVPTAMPSPKSRIGVSMLKVLGTVTDIAGIADIVTGALGLKQAVASRDAQGIFANSMTIASGAALAAAGILGTAALLAPLSATLAAAVSPLFLVGAVLGAAGFLGAAIWGYVKRHKQQQGATEDQTQFFRNLNTGLLRSNWWDKLEYYRYAWYKYKDAARNPNPAQSYLQWQNLQWQQFLAAGPDRGESSLDELSRGPHV